MRLHNMTNAHLSPFNPTQLIQLDEQELLARQQKFLAAASAENTRRSYRSAIRHFMNWGGYLPCDSALVLRYLLSHADLLNARTLAVRLTALSQWHCYQGFDDPTKHGDIRLSLRGIQRSLGKPARRAKALHYEELQEILRALARQTDVRAQRDAALLQLGFFGGFRRSELVSLEVGDLSFNREGLIVNLRQSKTDQLKLGINKAIPYLPDVNDASLSTSTRQFMCPVTAIKKWLELARISDGPLFRQISRWKQISVKGLSPAAVSDIVRRGAESAGLPESECYSAHSLRRGMATSAYRAGASFSEIKRQGAWRHDGTVQVYIDEAKLFEENAASKLMLKHLAAQNENSKPSDNS